MFERNEIETNEQNIGSVEKSAASVMEPLSHSINSNGNSAVLHASAVIGILDPFTTLSEKEEGIRSYKIKRGDTISWIAKQFGISIETVKAANPGIGSRLTPGKTLSILPVSGSIYNVSEGDTLELIAERYNADQNLIKVYNPSYADILVSGQGTLILPNVSTPTISKKETN
ncbi:MAG: LysM peptidoglycan-binding domain-containing protein [Patescibacteria group bacterium]